MVALTVVAIVAAVVALVMTAIVVSMLRNERRRSDARVEALMRLANAEGQTPVAQVPSAPTPSFKTVAPSPKAGARRPAQILADDFVDETPLELDLQPAVAGVDGLFAEPERSRPWARRIGIAAAVAVAAAFVGFTASSFTRTATTKSPATASTTTDSTAAPVAATSGDTPTLELLTLAYEQKEGTLTINGMVQNPKASSVIAAGVEVTALVFGSDGTVVASGKAPLDFSRLRPGDESPFVVRVPVTGNIARYRIGFRGNDGRVITHIDRRSAGPLARNE